jgi:hypothetical protein
MRIFKIIVYILISCIFATSSFADIYEWTDENGVKHYSNHPSAVESRFMKKTKEVPYDEEADHARMETERQERLELDRLELAQREAELELREAEAERKLAAADRVAEAAQREAEYCLDEARTSSPAIYRGGGFWCRDHRSDYSYPVSPRWYFRKKHTRSYQNQFSGLSPHPRNRHGKKHYGSKNRAYAHKNRYKTHYRRNRSYTTYQMNSRATTSYRGYRIGSSRVRLNGQRYPSLRSSGFGRRH